MKKTILFLTVLFASEFGFSYTNSKINQAFDSIEKPYKESQQILMGEDQIQSLNQLNDEERFKVAIMLRDSKILSQDLFDEVQKKPTKIQRQIESGKLSQKDRALYQLSLYAISGILVK